MRTLIFVAALGVFTLGASRCSKYAVHIDTSPVFAQEANDATVIIEGCGSQPVVGYTYCRVREGDPTSGTLRLAIPPTACQKASCAQVTVFFPDGTPSLGFAVPRGVTHLDLEWKQMVKRPTFEKLDRGFWPILLEWWWIDADGNEHRSVAEGEIRMRVIGTSYVPLHEVEESNEYAWRWQDENGRYRMTTAGRAWSGRN